VGAIGELLWEGGGREVMGRERINRFGRQWERAAFRLVVADRKARRWR
jgi:hypothetical protein